MEYPPEFSLDFLPLVGIIGLSDPPPPPAPKDVDQESPAFKRALLDLHGHSIKSQLYSLMSKSEVYKTLDLDRVSLVVHSSVVSSSLEACQVSALTFSSRVSLVSRWSHLPSVAYQAS
jgi:hypothetical protein